MNKKPKTIADLDINWTFIEDKCGVEPCQIIPRFQMLNPLLKGILIKPNNYIFHHGWNEIILNRASMFEARLEYFMTELNYFFYKKIKKEFVLSHFERISDIEYIIH